jgi:TolB protein
LTRRRALLLGAAVGVGAAAGLGVEPAAAVLRFDLNQGNVQPMAIALPDFLSGGPSDGQSAHAISQIITANLGRSGLFAPIDPHTFIGRITDTDVQPRYPDWRAINAQALVTGRVAGQPDGRLRAEFRLWTCSPALNSPASNI